MSNPKKKGTVLSEKAWENLLELSGGEGGESVIAELVGTFLRQSEVFLKDLRQAAQEKSDSKMEALCHSLKSSAAGIGAEELSRLCTEMETIARARKVSWKTVNISEIESALAAACAELSRRLGQLRKKVA